MDTATGSVAWSIDFRRESAVLGGVAHDGDGRLVVLAGASIYSLWAPTGETLWRRSFSIDNVSSVVLRTVILDEQGNAYFMKELCGPPRESCGGSIVSLDETGSERFEVWADAYARPVAVAYGRLLIAEHSTEGIGVLLDTRTGARIASLPGTFADSVPWVPAVGLISSQAGFFKQRLARDDVALTGFDLASGDIRWRFPINPLDQQARAELFTDEGSVLVANEGMLLEISPGGELLRILTLATPSGRGVSGANSLLIDGRWFSTYGFGTVAAYDLPGAPGEGRLGWNSRRGNAQGENRPREK